MYPKPPKTLKTIQDPSLNKLFEAAACRGTEETRLLELLPEKLRETCRYGGFTAVEDRRALLQRLASPDPGRPRSRPTPPGDGETIFEQ